MVYFPAASVAVASSRLPFKSKHWQSRSTLTVTHEEHFLLSHTATPTHPPHLRIPESFQFIYLFIHSLFAVVKPNRGDWSIDPYCGRLSFRSAVGGGGWRLDSGSQPTLVQRAAFKDLWTVLSTMYNIYFEWHSTTLRWWWSTLQFEHSNIQTCNWVVLKYPIHQSTFVYQVRNQRHLEVLFQFDRFSLLNFPIPYSTQPYFPIMKTKKNSNPKFKLKHCV